jgi:hypothetical protein
MPPKARALEALVIDHLRRAGITQLWFSHGEPHITTPDGQRQPFPEYWQIADAYDRIYRTIIERLDWERVLQTARQHHYQTTPHNNPDDQLRPADLTAALLVNVTWPDFRPDPNPDAALVGWWPETTTTVTFTGHQDGWLAAQTAAAPQPISDVGDLTHFDVVAGSGRLRVDCQFDRAAAAWTFAVGLVATDDHFPAWAVRLATGPPASLTVDVPDDTKIIQVHQPPPGHRPVRSQL